MKGHPSRRIGIPLRIRQVFSQKRLATRILILAVTLAVVLLASSDVLRLPSQATSSKDLDSIGQSKQALQSSVLVLSADGRRPRFNASINVSPSNATFYEWAALINLAYSEKRGYDYRFFVFEDNTGRGCSHRLHGKRNVAWCKLLALEKAILSFTSASQLLWLDSDAAWVRHDLSLPSFLEETGLGCSYWGWDTLKEGNATPVDRLNGCFTPKCNALKADASLLFFANRPFCSHAVMSGTFILKASEQGRQTVSRWWNLNACNNVFPWEQRAANYALYPNLNGHAFGHGGVEILSTSHNFHPSSSEAALHYGHFNQENKTRDELMRDAFRMAGLDEERDFARLAAKLQAHITVIETGELERLGQSLADITWDKALDKPDESWMIERNYSKYAEKWKDCANFDFVRPAYDAPP